MSEEITDYADELFRAKGNVNRQLEIVDSFIENVMVEGQDYGLIPNIPKPTLFKSGAEKLSALFEVKPQKVVTYRELDLNTFITIPDKFKPGTEKDKRIMGFVAIEVTCTLTDKNGHLAGSGLGACTNLESKMAQNAGAIYNNVIKMAGKRAYVDSILTLSLVSGRFTQDMEDLDKDDIASRGSSSSDGSEDGDDFVITFGSCKDKLMSEIPDASVRWYHDAAAKSVADPSKAGFKIKNQQIVNAAKKEMAKRGI